MTFCILIDLKNKFLISDNKNLAFWFFFFLQNLSLSGDELGIPNYAVPFLAPNSTGKAILHGVNYASGGGGIMNATGRIFVST